ncbi:MAG: hypothetical protein H7Y22_11365 [Gemmatimonadaceae bacterium]|nr:hypothetical protein [Gloeobacterales cyanobacterium ES-bin-141]
MRAALGAGIALWCVLGSPVVAQTEPLLPALEEPPVPTPEPVPVQSAVLKISGYAVLTLRSPVGGIEQRVQRALERFEYAVQTAAEPRIDVQVSGNDKGAFLLVNSRGILDVTVQDAADNATTRALPLAKLWASRLRAVVNRPEVLKALFMFSGLPERLAYANSEYGRGESAVPDRGRFTTDGTRITDTDGQNRVIFWEQRTPQPPPTIYLLNRFRQFVPYIRL